MKYSSHTQTILQRGVWADVLFWVGYTLLTQLAFAPDPLHPVNLLIMLAFLAAELTSVYGHLRYGLLRFIRKDIGVFAYLGIALASLVLGVLVCWVALALISLFIVEMRPTIGPAVFPGYWANRVGWSIGTLLALSSGLLLFTLRSRQQLREQKLKVANTRAELAYLRGQLNPHFLFNALNNIFLLIDRDPDRAKDSLLGFSDLLRYQLYTSEEDTVPLPEEVDQLRKFAALSRLRMEEGFVFQFEAPTICDRRIPPMLLLPLLENAFKYSCREDGFIRAKLVIHDTLTYFSITNKIGVRAIAPGRDDACGIGLSNLRRRLKLLYPERSALDIHQSNGEFTVNLQLPAL